MVSSNKAGFDLRENAPLPRNNLHNQELATLSKTGQRTDSKACSGPRSHQSWLRRLTSPKASAGYLNYPADVRDTAKSGIGHGDNRHLNYLVKSISGNVGGFYRDVKASSLPMPDRRVGAARVVRARENRVHGDRPQSVGIPRAK